jgi:hypothetical protein
MIGPVTRRRVIVATAVVATLGGLYLALWVTRPPGGPVGPATHDVLHGPSWSDPTTEAAPPTTAFVMLPQAPAMIAAQRLCTPAQQATYPPLCDSIATQVIQGFVPRGEQCNILAAREYPSLCQQVVIQEGEIEQMIQNQEQANQPHGPPPSLLAPIGGQ